MKKILSVRIPKNNYSTDYINLLNDIVKESLASFCESEDYYFCDKFISFTKSFNSGHHKIQWVANDEPLLLNEKQIKNIKGKLREVPYNSKNAEDHNARNLEKHSKLNKKWATGSLICLPLDGMYVTLDFPIEKEILDTYSVKLCNCIERHEGEYTYCIPDSLSIIDLLANNKYVNLFASAIISYRQNLDLSVLEYTIDAINNSDIVFNFKNLKYKKNLSMMDSLQYRLYLSSIGRKSLITQDFDGRYIVIYNGEEVVFDFDNGELEDKLNLKNGEDDILLGWKCGERTLSLFN